MTGSLRTMKKQFGHHLHAISLLVIILFAAGLRFDAFFSSWSFGGSDSTRDIIITAKALQYHILPLVGPFSSAGPFVTGPLYFWLLIPGVLFLPISLAAPFIYFILLSLVVVYLSFLIGKELAGRRGGFVFSFLAAVSPKLLVNAYSLRNPTLVLLFTFLLIYFFILLIRYQRSLFAFLAGLSIGLAINMHYQSLNLLLFLPATLLIYTLSFKKRFLFFIVMTFGCLLTFIPIITWDAQQQFANFRNVLDYFLIGQYRMYVPNSWKLFLIIFLPQTWADVIGGYSQLGALFALVVIGYVIYTITKFRRQKPEVILLMSIFFVLLFLNRYYHGIRTEGYVFYLSPFILIVTALMFVIMSKQCERMLPKKFKLAILSVSLLLVAAINLFSIREQFIPHHTNIAELNNSERALALKYPMKKFTIYDYKGENTAQSMTISLLLYKDHLEANNGIKVGIGCGVQCEMYPQIFSIGDVSGVDLSSTQLSQKNWQNVSTDNVYNALIGWSQRHELRSTFDFFAYLRQKV